MGIWAVDIGGYLFGKSFGKHKIFPVTSPKKTYEGLFGSLILLLFIQSFSWHFFNIFSLLEFLSISVLIFIGSIYGDYFESFFKRKYHIKDSGNLIPGHGGLLDRLDSAIYTIPMITILCLTIIN
jgi:phosphatidate cytidylyltransferase